MAMEMTGDLNGAFEAGGDIATGQTDADAARAHEAAQLHAERERVFRKARRHTYFVKFLKVLLPIGAIGLVGLFGVIISANHYVPVRKGDKFDIGTPVITRGGMVMENPKYQGFNKDGSKFFVTAKRATPDLKQPDRVAMNAISGLLTQADGQRTQIEATRGFYDGKKGKLELFERIDIVSQTGVKVQMNSAEIFIKENRVVTNQPVAAQMPTGHIRANSMVLQSKKRLASFAGGVAVRLTPKPRKKTGAKPLSKANPANPTSIMGNSQAPVDVVALSLDVDDNKKIAIFKGSVQAVQAGNKLTAQELEIEYEGKTAMPGTTGKPATAAASPGAAPEGTRLKLIKARQKVVMTSDQGRRATADAAEFDAVAETALLVGNVVLKQGLNTVNADRVKLNSKAQTALLTGRVRLKQGKNLLTGGRLFVNQKTATSRLTSPGRGGRIYATFYQQAKKGGRKARKAKLARARPAPLRFKSDPNAPIKIDAASLDVNDKVKSATFKGRVVARQGGMKIRAEVIVASYQGQTGMGASGLGLGGKAARGAKRKGAAAQLTRVEARKKVIIESADGQTATGDWADFDVKGNSVVLSGNVVLRQGSTVIYGEKLLIDMTTGKTKIIPRRGGQSVSSWGGRDKPFRAGAGNCPAGRTCLRLIPGQLQEQFKNGRKSNKGGGWNSTTLGLGGKGK